MAGAALRIGGVARRTGLSVRTLRHYDDLGLVVPSGRTSGDHRLYSPADTHRLLLVQHLKSLGLTLSEVKAALDDPTFDAAQSLADHIAVVEERLAAEHELLDRLHLLQHAAETGWEELLTVVALSERLENPEPVMRVRAALHTGTTVPLARLVALLASEDDPAVQESLSWAVARHGGAATAHLLDHLDDEDPEVRARIARALGKLGDPRAAPGLVARLDDVDPTVVSEAVFALGRTGEPAALDRLVALLGLPPGAAHETLTEAVAAYGEAAVTPAGRALRDDAPRVRAHAAEVLGWIGCEAAVPALVFALDDVDGDVRLEALLALGQVAGDAATPAIVRARDADDPRLRAVAARLRPSPPPPPPERTP